MNRGQLKTALGERTGYIGDAFDDRKNRYINFAQSEICVTQFNFLKKSWTISISSGIANVKNELDSDFSELDGDNVWISSTRLVRGSEEEILLNPPSTAGQPLKFCMADLGSNNRQAVLIGSPTADQAYTATVRGWRKPTDLSSDSETSIITTAYNDKPILTYAEYLLHLSVGEYQRAQVKYQHFIIDLLMMEEKLPYTGPSYAKALRKQLEEQQDKDSTQD